MNYTLIKMLNFDAYQINSLPCSALSLFLGKTETKIASIFSMHVKTRTQLISRVKLTLQTTFAFKKVCP